MATPLLVPMIEEGFINNRISHDIIEQYLVDPVFSEIEALILGCTHYPLIKKEIDSYFNGRVSILDSSEVIAKALKNYLEAHNLINTNPDPYEQFMVSDYTESFESTARMFFHAAVHLEKHPLWN
jgi:glutamate racemase